MDIHTMKCNGCGLSFDPSDLGQVFAHEHDNPIVIENGKYKGEVQTRNLIHIYKEDGQWCAIYPMFSTKENCRAIAYSPINIQYNEYLSRYRDYGFGAVLEKIKHENPKLPTHSYYTEENNP